jgi:hypothetical protein
MSRTSHVDNRTQITKWSVNEDCISIYSQETRDTRHDTEHYHDLHGQADGVKYGEERRCTEPNISDVNETSRGRKWRGKRTEKKKHLAERPNMVIDKVEAITSAHNDDFVSRWVVSYWHGLTAGNDRGRGDGW